MKKQKSVTFLCNKNEIKDFNESGQWSLAELKCFTMKTDNTVIIKNYGTIQDGEVRLIN